MSEEKFKQIIYNIGFFTVVEYYINNKLYRIDGPTMQYVIDFLAKKETFLAKKWYPNVLFSKIVCWFQNGKYHRIDGPAIEHINGHKEYWINGIEFQSYTHWALYCIQNDLWD